MYKIEQNTVLRDGAAVAHVLPDGTLDPCEGMEQYRTSSVKVLAKAGRRNPDGTFVFLEDASPAPQRTEEDAAPEQSRPVISTVRELVSAVEAASGDKAPELSKIYGDETPEVWAFLRRHVDAYNTVRANFDIQIKRNHMEE